MDIAAAGASFGLLFVMELGDKTQLAVFSLSGRTRQGPAVFAGATAALLILTLIAATLGAVAAEFLPEEPLALAAGAAFVAVGAFILWSGYRGRTAGRGEDSPAADTLRTAGTAGVAALAFGVTMVAELGDKSQLAVIGLAARTGQPVEVFAGAAAALALVTLLGVLAGAAIARRVPQRLVSLVAGVVFIVVGALSLAGVM